MNRKKIMFIILGVVFLIGLGKVGLVEFEKAKTKPYKFMRSIETTVDKFKPKVSTEEKKINDHMFYVSTPIGSVGIL